MIVLGLIEIDLKSAIERYQKGENVFLLRPSDKTNHMILYTLDEIFKSSKFLIDENIPIETSVSQNISDDIDASLNTDTEHGVNTLKRTKSRVKIDLGKLKALKDAHWTKKQVAEEFRCCYATVNKYWDEV